MITIDDILKNPSEFIIVGRDKLWNDDGCMDYLLGRPLSDFKGFYKDNHYSGPVVRIPIKRREWGDSWVLTANAFKKASRIKIKVKE